MTELAWAETPAVGEVEPDAVLVRAAQRNPAAFAPLYRRYVQPIHRYLYSRTGNTADAEDLTAEVFTEALAALPRYRERGSFAAWLFTIARRRAADHHRRAAHLPLDAALPEPELAAVDPLGQSMQDEAMRTLAALVGQLDEEDQELLRLRFAGGLTYRQISELVGRSEAAVKMAVYRLCRRLEQAWEVSDDSGK